MPQDDEEAEKENDNFLGEISDEEGEGFGGISDDDEEEEAMVGQTLINMFH